MMTVTGSHYIFRGYDFLQINCVEGICERLEALPIRVWWSNGPVYFYNQKAYVLNRDNGNFHVYEVTVNPPTFTEVWKNLGNTDNN